MAMHRHILFFLFVLCSLFSYQLVNAQDKLIKSLISEGLQNIQSLSTQDELILSYENNRYRYQAEALAFVLNAIGKFSDGTDEMKVSILLRHKGLPISSVSASLGTLREFANKSIQYSGLEQLKFGWEVSRLDRILKEAPNHNSSYKKIDLPVGVQLDYQLGNFDNAVRVKFNIQPEFSTVLSKGLTASSTYTIPTWNDLDNFNGSRVVIARLSQDIRLGNRVFINITGGAFTRNRLGIVSNMHYYLADTEQWRIHASFSETDFGFFDSSLSLLQVPENYRMYHLGMTYRNRQLHTDIDIRYGRFLFRDEGYKLNMTRQIDEVFIGFFIHKSNTGDQNVGFEFQVPVGLKKHLRPMKLRPMTREFFYLPYYYSGTGVGLNFYAGENTLLNIKEFYPSTLKRALTNYLEQ